MPLASLSSQTEVHNEKAAFPFWERRFCSNFRENCYSRTILSMLPS